MTRHIIARNNLLIQPLGDEAIALNLDNEMYYKLNAVAYDSWRVLIEGKSIEETCQVLQATYDVPSDVLLRDIESFIKQLYELKLIEIHDS